MSAGVENEDDFERGYDQALEDVLSLIKDKLGSVRDGEWEPDSEDVSEVVAELEKWKEPAPWTLPGV